MHEELIKRYLKHVKSMSTDETKSPYHPLSRDARLVRNVAMRDLAEFAVYVSELESVLWYLGYRRGDVRFLLSIASITHKQELEVAEKDAVKWRDDDSPQAETTFGVHKGRATK